MLPTIDSRSLFVASAVVFGGLIISVILAWRELRAMKGPDRFAKSYALFLVGLVLFALRGQLPDFFTMTVANVLVVLGAALVLEGTKLFFGLRPGRLVTIWAVAASTAAFAFYSHVRVDGDARTILSSALLSALLGAAGWTAWHHRPRTSSQVLEKVTAFALSGCAVLFWARAVAIGSGLVGGEMLGASAWMAVPPLLCTLCAVVWTTTLLATTSRKLTNVVQSQNDLLAGLLTVARAAGSEASLAETLEKVLEAARSVTGASGSSLILFDEKGRFTNGLFTEGTGAREVGREEAEKLLESGLAGWVVHNRKIAVVPDVYEDPRWHRFLNRSVAVRSALSAPISSGSVLSGVLTLAHTAPGHFGEEQRHLIESTTAQIALALRTAQIADARLRATRGQALLNEILEISARLAETERIAVEAAEALGRSPFWRRAFLALPGEDGHFRLYGTTGDVPGQRPRIDEGIMGRVLQTGTTHREEAQPGASAGPEPGEGPGSRIVVPLRQFRRTLGVASFESARHRDFDAEDASLAEALAEAVSLGLGKAALARAREELTRTMVHDLRGPISGVMGALELLDGAPGLEEADRRLLDAAERNARRQLKLVEGILELARLEDGALPVRHEDVKLGDLAEEVVRLARPAAEARGLELVCEIPGELPVVRADPGLVSRVLENLVGNAIKFSAPGAGPIRLRARLDGTLAEVHVHDSGPGVEESLRPRVFEKFVVGNLAGRGSGLGLAFCRLAVEAQGGRIWLEDPGPGAVFAFGLPLADPPAT